LGFEIKMSKILLLVTQIVISLILIALILIQTKGVGLSSPFGGKLGTYSTKRGVESLIFKLTILVAILFFVSSLAQLLLG